MHIIFDWDGTIAKPEVAKNAGMIRNEMLNMKQAEEELKEHMKTDGHFDILRAYLKQKTKIEDQDELTTMMTDIFRIGYYTAVAEMGEEVLYDGMRSTLEKLAENNTLTIASTLRQDLLEHSLKLLSMEELFAGVYANNPQLHYSKSDLIKKAIKNHGKGDWMVGDKMDDVVSGRENGTKTVFVDWGAGELKDFDPEIIAYKPEDLLKMD